MGECLKSPGSFIRKSAEPNASLSKVEALAQVLPITEAWSWVSGLSKEPPFFSPSQVLQDMGLPTGVEGKESVKGDESAEETEQKPVVVAPPPVVETVSTPSAASPPSEQTTEVNAHTESFKCVIPEQLTPLF